MIGIDSLPASWKLVKCQDVIDVRDGTHDTPVKMPDGIPLITSKNLKDEGIDFSDVTYISEEAHREIEKRSRVDDRDIIFAMIGTIGNPVIVTKDRPFSIKNIALFKLGSSAVYPEYFKHLLSTNFITRQLDSSTRGGSQKFVSLQVLRNLIIPLPRIDQQKRIAAILDKAKELRRLRRQSIEHLDVLSRSIFIEMFGDPITNPRGWKILKFGEVGTLDRGVSKHRPRNAPELLDGRYPLVQTGEVSNCNGYIRHYQNTYSEIGLRQSKIWMAGTLCITIAANIAKTGILTFDACFPDSVVGFLTDDPATIEFIRIWLSFLQKMLEDTAPESAQKNINLSILRNLDVPFPPLPLQQEFAQRIEAIESLKTKHRESLTHLDILFASLQHRAFRGEL